MNQNETAENQPMIPDPGSSKYGSISDAINENKGNESEHSTEQSSIDQNNSKKSTHAPLKLYSSYIFSQWGDRMWMFASSLILVCIGGDLQLTAISGFVNDLAVLIFGTWVGRFIDRSHRFKAASIALTVNNLAVAASAGLFLSVLYWRVEINDIAGLRTTLLVFGILFGAIGRLAQTGANIVMTKDWMVVLCDNDKSKLAEMNAMLLRISLSAMILSPLVAGEIMSATNTMIGCLFITCWHLATYLIEWYLLWNIYRAIPALSHKRVHLESETETKSVSNKLKSGLKGWKIYFKLDIFPGGLSLALLYMTVLGLDGITTGYTYHQGIKENILAAVRGVGALFGIAGSILYPILMKKIGLQRTGLIALVAEVLTLSLCIISIFLPGSPFDVIGYYSGKYNTIADNSDPILLSVNSTVGAIPSGLFANQTISKTQAITTEALCKNGDQIGHASSPASIWTFLAGVVLARFGLWMADLSITQIYQEQVKETERGVVNGVQASMNQLMDLFKNVLVIIFPSDQTFGILIIASFSSVVAGLISFAFYSRKVRGHLFHFSKIKTVMSNAKLLRFN